MSTALSVNSTTRSTCDFYSSLSPTGSSSFLKLVMKVLVLSSLFLNVDTPFSKEQPTIHFVASDQFSSLPTRFYKWESAPPATCSQFLNVRTEFTSNADRLQNALETMFIRPLHGLSLLDDMGALEIVYPKKGESIETCFKNLKLKTDSINFKVKDCLYLTSGTLICPNKYRFRKLKAQFEKVCL
jgi:hypothetical protein